MHSRGFLAVAALTAALALGGCGGSEPDAKTARPTQAPAPKGMKSVVAGDALVNAQCAPDAEGEGVWAASGVVKNRAKTARSFDVVVQIGPADGQESPAVVKKLGKIAGGKTAEFAVSGIRPSVPTGPCHLQVRVLVPRD